MHFDADKHTVFLTLGGSHAYGTSRPDSDVDLRGVIIPPKKVTHGWAYQFDQTQAWPYQLTQQGKLFRPLPPGDKDCVRFSLAKLFKEASRCGPSFIELLFTPPSKWVYTDPAIFPVLEQRRSFLSLRAYHSFSGYAHAQYKRIRRHRQWLLNPPKKEPLREEFGLKASGTLIPTEQLNTATFLVRKKLNEWLGNPENIPKDVLPYYRGRMAKALLEMWQALNTDPMPTTLESVREEGLTEDTMTEPAMISLGFDSNFIEYYRRERAWKNAKRHWDSYQTWLRERNPYRKGLEDKAGYDLKHAMHLARLMKMAEEVLLEGKVIVERPDADWLRGILDGYWTFERLESWFSEKDRRLQKIYEEAIMGKKELPVPKEPDREALNELYISTVEMYQWST